MNLFVNIFIARSIIFLYICIALNGRDVLVIFNIGGALAVSPKKFLYIILLKGAHTAQV